jgi:hypothetical protein
MTKFGNLKHFRFFLNSKFQIFFLFSYYYGKLNRDDVHEILNDADIGTFLIRDSLKDSNQKVLCVK